MEGKWKGEEEEGALPTRSFHIPVKQQRGNSRSESPGPGGGMAARRVILLYIAVLQAESKTVETGINLQTLVSERLYLAK